MVQGRTRWDGTPGLRLVAAGLAGILCMACTPQQRYAGGQSYQRHACQNIPDEVDRTRCLEAAGTTLEEYQRNKEAVGR